MYFKYDKNRSIEVPYPFSRIMTPFMTSDSATGKIDFSVHMTELGLDELRSILTKRDGICDVLIVRCGEKKEFLYLGSDEHFKELKNVLSLRGGGRGGVYQGSYISEPELLFSSAKGVIDEFKG